MPFRAFFALLVNIILFFLPTVDTIACYTCHSRNGTDANCHDPYNPALSTYMEKCMEPKKGHIGRFPANFCLKMTGVVVSTGELLVIRRCALDNMDNQCGVFKFNDDILRGCILTCNYNGCNKAPVRQEVINPVFLCLTSLLLYLTVST